MNNKKMEISFAEIDPKKKLYRLKLRIADSEYNGKYYSTTEKVPKGFSTRVVLLKLLEEVLINLEDYEVSFYAYMD